jgi:hypothetical protein
MPAADHRSILCIPSELVDYCLENRMDHPDNLDASNNIVKPVSLQGVG